eukprot:1695303-Prymnesium_polylepis.1
MAYDDSYKCGCARISFAKHSAPHLSHIFAYLNAYERIRILDQLMAMDVSKVVWMDKDDITCERHDFEIMPYMKERAVKTSFLNERVECYVTNVWQVDGSQGEDTARLQTKRIERPGGAVACLGCGGGGKTTKNLQDDGAVGVCLVAPSYDLLDDKGTEFGVGGVVKDVALGPNFDRWQALARTYSTFVWDEISE